jgi:hypothetical protein
MSASPDNFRSMRLYFMKWNVKLKGRIMALKVKKNPDQNDRDFKEEDYPNWTRLKTLTVSPFSIPSRY